MSIRYYVRKSKLLGKTFNCGRVDLKGSYNREMIIERMLEMGSGITKADILGVLTNYEKAIKNICLEGNKVTLEGFMQFTPAISGTFSSETDVYDPMINDVYITAQISTVYNSDFKKKAVIEKIPMDIKRPMLIEVIDIAGKSINDSITQTSIVSINGEFLKFDITETDEYLKFIDANDQKNVINITVIQKLTDKEIVFMFPATSILEGYFEIATKSETTTLKVGRSSVIKVIQK